jgi:hypothetical protein
MDEIGQILRTTLIALRGEAYQVSVKLADPNLSTVDKATETATKGRVDEEIRIVEERPQNGLTNRDKMPDKK